MDDGDRAQAINEQLQADALSAHRRQLQTGPGATHCEECEEPIPKKRRDAVPGCTRCIACQTDFERGL